MLCTVIGFYAGLPLGNYSLARCRVTMILILIFVVYIYYYYY